MKFTVTKNTGGAFNVGSDNLMSIIIINIIIIGVVIRFLIMQFEKLNSIMKWMLCMILAGGISNLLDRLIRGFVVDYINIGEVFPFPIFNLADIFVVIGWTILAIVTIIDAIKLKK